MCYAFLNFVNVVCYVVLSILRRVYKVFMRKITRLTELQRIMYGEVRGYRRISQIENSLLSSRNPGIVQALAELDIGIKEGRFNSRGTRKALVTQCAAQIATAKRINIKLHSRFLTGLKDTLEVICAFKCLCVRVRLLRDMPYNSENSDHEDKLITLWKNMVAEELSNRKSKQWEHLGFQGHDPATDFRGAGVLSLDSLLFITNTYPEIARRLLENSHHVYYSYPYALVVIQVSYFAAEICFNGISKTHFYNRYPVILALDDKVGPSDGETWGNELLKLFHEFCASLVVDFDNMWMAAKPKTIMEYSNIKAAFDSKIISKLKYDEACFLMEVRTV